VEIRPARAEDRDWIARQLRSSWGSTTIVSRGVAVDASGLPAYLACEGGELVGLVTYRVDGAECELVTLDALVRWRGIGSALLAAVIDEARACGCARIWLITSNDNLDAIRFYQRRGMRLVAVHSGAIDAARSLKPAIPLVGDHGIPVHDELEFELVLPAVRSA
jgi:GNAT superfamily N-acetyltransferase